MKKLHIIATDDSPEIIFDAENGIFSITGRSLPENANTLFASVFEWLREYFAQPNDETVIAVKLDYYNSASAKKIVELFLLLEGEFEKGTAVKVVWYYKPNDFTMQKKGRDLVGIFKIPNEFIAI